MSKISRIFALIMCCVLTLTLLVSCGETDMEKVDAYLKDNKPTPEAPYITLNMYIPCKFDPETPDAKYVIEEMQKEFNAVIEAKYRYRVIFKFVKEDQYESVVTAQRDYAMPLINDPLDNIQTNIQDKFPLEDPKQFDIFVATSETMVKNFYSYTTTDADGQTVEQCAIYTQTPNGDTLTNALDTYYYVKFCKDNNPSSMSSVIYDNAVDNGVRYGIPTNFLIGNYTYYAVNIAAAEELLFEEDANLSPDEKIKKLKNNIQSANEEIIKKGLDKPLWDESDIIKEDLTDLSAYPASEYYHLVKNKPELTSADLYRGMFCIAATCRYPGAALAVIAELYNNIDLHTTLQYGAKYITYTLEEVDGETVVVPLANPDLDFTYSINSRYTGNVTMLYPCIPCKDDCTANCIHVTMGGGIALTRAYFDKIFAQNKDAHYVK